MIMLTANTQRLLAIFIFIFIFSSIIPRRAFAHGRVSVYVTFALQYVKPLPLPFHSAACRSVLCWPLSRPRLFCLLFSSFPALFILDPLPSPLFFPSLVPSMILSFPLILFLSPIWAYPCPSRISPLLLRCCVCLVACLCPLSLPLPSSSCVSVLVCMPCSVMSCLISDVQRIAMEKWTHYPFFCAEFQRRRERDC